MSVFEKNNSGCYLIDTGFPGLTAGTAAKACSRVDYSAEKNIIRAGERKLLAEITGAEKKNIIFLDQVHGAKIVSVDEYPAAESYVYASADALITPLKNLCLVIRTADCVPVLMFDNKNSIIAAVHAGWKGSMLSIAGLTVNIMREKYSSSPEDIRAWILPCAGPRSYEVQDDVARCFPKHTFSCGGKLFIDLPGSNAGSLAAAGIPPENIFRSEICTMHNNAEFFSHRKGDTGRSLNFIYTA